MKTAKISQKHTGGRGYTIIEVMIFLAVSGFMFVLAAIFINGKQANVAYRQGLTAANSMITSTINSVANGEYVLPENFGCRADGDYPHLAPPPPETQGANGGHQPTSDVTNDTNSGCIFLGKVVEFGTNADKTEYKTYTVVGRQYTPTSGSCPADINTQPVQSFCEAMPTSFGQLTDSGVLEHGLTFATPVAAYRCDGDCSIGNRTPIGGVGFFGGFGSYAAGQANSQSSGAQSVAVASLPTGSMPDNIKNLKDSNVLSSNSYIVLCFNRGDKVGSVVIGGHGGQQTETSVNYGKNSGVPC